MLSGVFTDLIYNHYYRTKVQMEYNLFPKPTCFRLKNLDN